MGFFKSFLGDPNQKEVSRYQSLVAAVAEHEIVLEKKTDAELKEISSKLKQKISEEVKKILTETSSILDLKERNKARKRLINDLLAIDQAMAFALVRESAKRYIGMRHYDVQIIGGAVLHQGQIAEMKTGEGKTLVATLPLYLNALTGLGAHLITVNDYLARRDAGWMGPIFDRLGLSVGVIGPQFSYIYDTSVVNDETDSRLKHFREVSRSEAYAADITYGTNNEYGFDYLRDNMAQSSKQVVQRGLTYAIVDEVDSILIDEARTPLIISAPSSESADNYQKFANLIPRLQKEIDYLVDEKAHAATLTDAGISKLEELLGLENLYDPAHVELVHHADTALKAYALYHKNKEYVVKNGEIIIVDEFTGRMLIGRRYSGGLHQAIEAKEKVIVKEESVTLATITFQNYFRIYTKLAGMTGTAATEAEELAKIYELEVVAIPPNRPNVRLDRQDQVYKSEAAKFKAVVELVKELNTAGQPVLIGTVSIAKSEVLSKQLKAAKLEYTVLNAKLHQKEGEIISQAGRPGAITVATNMAGRGVDIILGGTTPEITREKEAWKKWEVEHEKVIKMGGLFVIGTERHESRRIDNQLRGRAARQGDPGVTQFFLSMEDDLMRIFGGERMKSIMERLNLPDEMSINNTLLTKAIEQAQSKVETHNFEIRKQLVDYDDVMNKHREAIYRRRESALLTDQDNTKEFHEEILALFSEEQRIEYLQKIKTWTKETIHQIEQLVTLRAIDVLWVEHLKTMESLRESIGLRGYGQREPLVEYKRESYDMFQQLQKNIDNQITDLLLRAQLQPTAPIPQQETLISKHSKKIQQDNLSQNSKIGRNDPCPCGATDPQTGKVYKYKKCGLINAPHHRA